jgi:hypothetical protein
MAAPLKVTRFLTVPQTLYRVQGRLPVRLRDFDTQTAKGRTSFDLKIVNGLILPAKGPVFTGSRPFAFPPHIKTLRWTRFALIALLGAHFPRRHCSCVSCIHGLCY